MHQGAVTAHSSAVNWLCRACKRSNNTVHVRMDASRVTTQAKQVLLISTPTKQAAI
jgi:hypothetical protein